jgi:hypothetical protein
MVGSQHIVGGVAQTGFIDRGGDPLHNVINILHRRAVFR